MKVREVCVRRLKTIGYYSNVAVEVCAEVDPSESVDEVYTSLLKQADKMIAATPEIERLEDVRNEIQRLKKSLDEEIKKYDTMLEKYHETLANVREARQKIEDDMKTLQELMERQKSVLDKLKDFLKPKEG